LSVAKHKNGAETGAASPAPGNVALSGLAADTDMTQALQLWDVYVERRRAFAVLTEQGRATIEHGLLVARAWLAFCEEIERTDSAAQGRPA
jgi:hypothetical protein